MQRLRIFADQTASLTGTHDAVSRVMRSDESWTIPLQVIMWTVIGVGLIMALAVFMMH
jgi:hypothetical protein